MSFVQIDGQEQLQSQSAASIVTFTSVMVSNEVLAASALVSQERSLVNHKNQWSRSTTKGKTSQLQHQKRLSQKNEK